jgi:transposase InsO family protein
VRKEDSPLLGIKLDLSEPHGTCEGCIAGKEKRRTFKSSSNRTSEPLEIIHSDLAGPMESVSIGGNRYFVIFLDGATSHVWVVFMKTKDQTLGVFKTFTAMIQKLTGRNIKIFRSDRGGEFMSEAFSKFLEDSGISCETSAPRTPQQNGFAERMMRTLVGSARAMLQHARLLKGFWSEAVAAAAHIHNRSPRRGLGWKTPHKLLRGRTPDISYLRVFGCRAWVYTPKDQRKKWDANSQPMIFVGYEPGSKSYRLWNLRTRSIVISASVCFDETYFPRKPIQDPPVITQGSPVEQSVQIPLLIEDKPPIPQPVAPVLLKRTAGRRPDGSFTCQITRGNACATALSSTTGGKDWCSGPGHRKSITRKWTKFLLHSQ